MATMSSFGNAVHRYQDTASRGALRRFLQALARFLSGVADGAAADRAYHELTRLGASHAKAVEIVLGRHLRTR
jgi:hypothetical protein